jgi:hypothetical protein
MRPVDNIEKLIKKLRYKAGAEAHDRILGNVLQALEKKEKQKPAAVQPDIWRKIMKSPVTKLAAAAVIIIAALIGLHQFAGPFVEGTPTFAQVIQPIFDAQTAILDIIVGEEEASGPVIHDMIWGSRIRRTLSNMKNDVSIIDLETGRILSLDYMEILRNVITQLQGSPDFVVEELGEQEIQGQRVIGFCAKNPKIEITIWADPHTALPIRIEQVGGQMKVICKNVVFDVPMDKELFSMDVPEGYKQQQAELDLYGATEEDFIEGLRIRAEFFGDGRFPDGVAVEDYLRQAPAIVKKINELGLSDDEKTKIGMKLTKHLLFIRFFKGEGKWHYAGRGIELGDADTAIFWYQPKDSETYRVIYGDLHVENVAQENLPK